ncbi:MAG: hypothetical protein M0Z76_09075 [Gammaproteobacteria bacterium]|nr:hypothetical protein [Gammaproteobacteria bacterium]
MSAIATVTKKKRRQHRGVVAGFIDDLIKPGWQDWMEVPAWPETTSTVIFGLTPLRWEQLADLARTIQEREIALMLGDHSTVAEVADAMRLSPKRVEQVARGLFDRVAKPKAQIQVDMFEADGGDA